MKSVKRLLILLCYVLNPQHYHWYAAAHLSSPEGSNIVGCSGQRGSKLSHIQRLWALRSDSICWMLIQYVVTWCVKWSLLKSNQRELIRNMSIIHYNIKPCVSKCEWIITYNSRFSRVDQVAPPVFEPVPDSEADALPTRPPRTRSYVSMSAMSLSPRIWITHP